MATEIIKKRDLLDWQRFCEQVRNTTNVPFREADAKKSARKKQALKDYAFFTKTYFPMYAQSDCGYFQIEAANEVAKDPHCFAVWEWPREHAKSVHADIIFPMWLKAKGLLTGMILMGKNETDAANLLSDIQAQLQFNQLYAYDFGKQYNTGSWETGDFTTVDGVRFIAIGRDQSPRGARKNEKRPNYAVIDDIDDDIIVNNPRRVKEIVDRIMGALYFALSTKGARLVVAGNRIHPQSVLAHLVGDLKPGMPKREGIYHSKVFATEKAPGVKAYIEEGGVPAWKERYTIPEISNKMKKAGLLMGRREFYHEHHIEGEIFKESMINFKPMPRSTWKKYQVIIGYFDPSFENKVTSDTKAVRVWGLLHKDAPDYEKHCLKSFVRRTELETCYQFMSDFEDKAPAGVGVIWYAEEQFFNRPMKQALERHNHRRRAMGKRPLYVSIDTRDKEQKYARIVKMEPEYSDNNVFYNLDEIYDTDMIEGNNQLKGIEPGYKSPDDSPDADEGAWYYLDKHLPTVHFPAVIGKRGPQSHY
jgi:hypothetical protein